VDERARRIGVNEAMFREINERIESLNEAFGPITGTMSVVCECGGAMCIEQIQVEPGDYERIRGDATLFIIVPGHEVPDVETVVERVNGYHVVRKNPGEPERVAEETDPRS
jgi:hypothetical protein